MGQVKKLWFLGGWPVDKVVKGQKQGKPKKRKKVKTANANNDIHSRS